jgi:hypothetical protein
MTTAGQAFLYAGELFCLSFAAIAMVYFADRLRSDFLAKRALQRRGSSSQRHVARDDRVRSVRCLRRTEALT